MSRLTTLRSTLAASALVLLLASPALAALPPGLVDPPPAPAAPQEPAPPAQPAPPPAAPAAPRTPAGPMVFDPDFQVQNRSRNVIVELNVSSSRVDSWGPNLLGRGRIEPGQNFMVRLERNGECEYDVRVVYEGGRQENRMRENVCAINEMVFAGPQQAGEQTPGAQQPGQPGQVRIVDTLRQPDPPEQPQGRRRTAQNPPQEQPAQRQTANQRPDIWVVNRSATEITAIQSSPISDPNWGQNRLTGQPIAAGQRFALLLPANLGCEWDIRVTYRGGQTEERRNVNFCEIEQIEFAGQRRTSR